MSYVNVDNFRGKKGDKSNKDSLESALREFRKQVKGSGVMNELKKKEWYMSPATKRRFKKNEAIKRRRREDRKQEWYNKNNKN